jgi:hypothetical protein
MNTRVERLHASLESLGLKALPARLENLLEQACKKESSCADFLDELLSCEAEARRTRAHDHIQYLARCSEHSQKRCNPLHELLARRWFC